MTAPTEAAARSAGDIIRRRLGHDPAYEAAVKWWLERNRSLELRPGLASQTREQGNLRGGAR